MVRRAEKDDRQAILALMDAARGKDLSAAERAERGFVQGTMNEEVITRFLAGTGVFIATEDGELAGFAMTSEPGAVTAGPAKLTVNAALDGEDPATTRLFLYGPAAVDHRFQGRGVLTMLLVALSRELAGRFNRGVAFVEAANAKSVAVHRHYGMTQRVGFRFDGREYLVFTFDPGEFAARTG